MSLKIAILDVSLDPRIQVWTIQFGPEEELRFLPQGARYCSQKDVRRIVLWSQEKNGEVMTDLLQFGADRDLFIAGKRRAHDDKVILPHQCPPDSLIDRNNQISRVASLGQDIRTRTQPGNITAYREYAVT